MKIENDVKFHIICKLVVAYYKFSQKDESSDFNKRRFRYTFYIQKQKEKKEKSLWKLHSLSENWQIIF